MAIQSHHRPVPKVLWSTPAALVTLALVLTGCDRAKPLSISISPENADMLETIGNITVAPLYGVNWPTGSPVLAVIRSERAHVYDLDTLTEQVLQIEHPKVLAFTQSGDEIAVAAADGELSLWDLAGELQTTFQGHTANIDSMAFSEDTRTLATLDIDKQVFVWDLENSRPTSVIDLSAWPSATARIETIAISPDGTTLALLSIEQFPTLKLWDIHAGITLRTLAWVEPARPFYNFVFSSDWGIVAWVAGGTVQLMDVSTGAAGATLTHEDALSEWRFSPDGRILATRTAETIAGEFTGVVKLWDTESGAARHTLTHPDFVSAMAFSPDWKYIATATGFGEIHLWETRTGRETALLSGHSDTVWALIFSPDGAMLASASGDGSLHLWDPSSAEALASLSTTPKTSLADVQFSRNGDWIAAVSDNGEITIWGISKEK